jgi:hypothetical protein
MPGNAYVKSFGGTRFIYANKTNIPQKKLFLELPPTPIPQLKGYNT